MPIFAPLDVNETSVNTGAPAGNELPTVTLFPVPLTEIVAVAAFTATGFGLPVIRADAVEPAFAPADVLDAGRAEPAPAAQSPEAAALRHSVAICWWKGSLLLNLLNETSWPLFGGSGLLGSEMPSVDFGAAEAALEALGAAVDDPSREGGASGVEPATVDVVVDGLEEELAVGDFIIFIVRGT